MSFKFKRTKHDERRIGFTRVRDSAYDAVCSLWKKRKAEGMTQQDICAFLDRDPAWVSRNLAGPSNWTLRTFGELTEALNGVVSISVLPREEIAPENYDIYAELFDEHHVTLEPLETKVSRGGDSVIVDMRIPGEDSSSASPVPRAFQHAG